jgi:hypothetical protein
VKDRLSLVLKGNKPDQFGSYTRHGTAGKQVDDEDLRELMKENGYWSRSLHAD